MEYLESLARPTRFLEAKQHCGCLVLLLLGAGVPPHLSLSLLMHLAHTLTKYLMPGGEVRQRDTLHTRTVLRMLGKKPCEGVCVCVNR